MIRLVPTLLGLVRLTRPLNVALAAAGAAAGSYVWALEPVRSIPVWSMAAAALGVAGANALNDSLDAALDRNAHPGRPIPRGAVDVRTASFLAWFLLAAATVCAVVASLWCALVAAVLFALVVAYEYRWKRQGLVGNIVVSLLVAGTFLLGAADAMRLPGSDGFAVLGFAVGLVVLALMALLSFLANLAREIYKDVEDVAADEGHRRTLPMVIGAASAMHVARALLLAAVGLGFGFGILGLGEFRVPSYVVLGACALFFVAVVMKSPPAARAWTKAGMVVAVIGFVAIGLI